MTRWDYKRVTFDIGTVASEEFEVALGDLGGDGWELTLAVPHEHHGYSREVHLVFRRPRAEA